MLQDYDHVRVRIHCGGKCAGTRACTELEVELAPLRPASIPIMLVAAGVVAIPARQRTSRTENLATVALVYVRLTQQEEEVVHGRVVEAAGVVIACVPAVGAALGRSPRRSRLHFTTKHKQERKTSQNTNEKRITTRTHVSAE